MRICQLLQSFADREPENLSTDTTLEMENQEQEQAMETYIFSEPAHITVISITALQAPPSQTSTAIVIDFPHSPQHRG